MSSTPRLTRSLLVTCAAMFVTTPSLAIEYSLVPTTLSGGRLTGNIVTDGTTGPLTAENITAWNISFSDDIRTYDLVSSHVNAVLDIHQPSQIVATETTITLYDSISDSVALRIVDGPSSTYCAEIISIEWASHATSEDQMSLLTTPTFCDYPDFTAYAGIEAPFVIATAVPEPSTIVMLLCIAGLPRWHTLLRNQADSKLKDDCKQWTLVTRRARHNEGLQSSRK